MSSRKSIRQFLEFVLSHKHINNISADNHFDKLIIVLPLLKSEISRPRLLQVVATFTLQECGMLLPAPHPRDINLLLSPIDRFVSFRHHSHKIIV
jgi:hypothetical protein